eukprot:g12400.t1
MYGVLPPASLQYDGEGKLLADAQTYPEVPHQPQPEEMSSCFLVWYRSPKDAWDKTNFPTALAAFWQADMNRKWSLGWESVRCVGIVADRSTQDPDQLHFKADPAFALKPTEALALFQHIGQYQIPRIVSVHTTTNPTPWLNATESSNAMRLVREGLTQCLTSRETYAGVATSRGKEAPECNYARAYVIEPVFQRLMQKYEPGKEHSQNVAFAGPTGSLTTLTEIKFESVALCSVDTTYHHCDFLLCHVGREYNLIQISSYGGYYGVVGCMLGEEADVLDGRRSASHFKEIMTHIKTKCKGRWWTTQETRAFLEDCATYAGNVRTRDDTEEKNDADLWREQLSFALKFSEQYFGVSLDHLGLCLDKLWQDCQWPTLRGLGERGRNQAKLAEITFRWSNCAPALVCRAERCFAGCTVVLERTLGANGTIGQAEEARLRPDVTILDQHQKVVALVEVLISSRKEQRHWEAYAKCFPHAVALEIDFNTEAQRIGAGYVLQDTKRRLSGGAPCAPCAAQQAENLRAKLAQAQAQRQAALAAQALAEQKRRQELATQAVQARALIQTELSKITFRWSACAAKLAPLCRRRRRFEGCTAVHCNLGTTGLLGLTVDEAEYKPDLTVLDRNQKVVALIEIYSGCHTEPRRWQTYNKFPGVIFLAVYVRDVLTLDYRGYTLTDEKFGAQQASCRFCVAEQKRQLELAARAAQARALIQAELSKITFRWSACASGLAPQCQRQRRFEGCTAVHCPLGTTSSERLWLTFDEATVPDLTVLDQYQQVMAFIEICIGSQKEPRRWQAYDKFPRVIKLEIHEGSVRQLAENGYTLTDVRLRTNKTPCIFCVAATRAARERHQVAIAQEEERLQMQLAEEELERQCDSQRTVALAGGCQEATALSQNRAACTVQGRLKRMLPPRVQEQVLAGGLPAWLSDDEAAVFPSLTYTPGAAGPVWALKEETKVVEKAQKKPLGAPYRQGCTPSGSQYPRASPVQTRLHAERPPDTSDSGSAQWFVLGPAPLRLRDCVILGCLLHPGKVDGLFMPTKRPAARENDEEENPKQLFTLGQRMEKKVLKKIYMLENLNEWELAVKALLGSCDLTRNPVEYMPGKQDKKGRAFGEGSMGNVPKWIMRLVSGYYYESIDISNAAATILVQLADRERAKVPDLFRKYVNGERESMQKLLLEQALYVGVYKYDELLVESNVHKGGERVFTGARLASIQAHVKNVLGLDVEFHSDSYLPTIEDNKKLYGPVNLNKLANDTECCRELLVRHGYENKLLRRSGLRSTTPTMSGENVAVPRKNKTAFTGLRWKIPMIMGGNWVMNYNDEQGQWKRRLALTLWHQTPGKVQSDLKERIARSELPYVLLRCIARYRMTVQEKPSADFWREIAPDELRQNQKYVESRMNVLARFLHEASKEHGVIPDKGRLTLWEDFISTYEGYLKELKQPSTKAENIPHSALRQNDFEVFAPRTGLGAGRGAHKKDGRVNYCVYCPRSKSEVGHECDPTGVCRGGLCRYVNCKNKEHNAGRLKAYGIVNMRIVPKAEFDQWLNGTTEEAGSESGPSDSLGESFSVKEWQERF